MKYKVHNPGKSMIPISVKTETGFGQINLLPNNSVVIDESQMTETIRDLASAPRFILRVTEVLEKRVGNKNYVRKNKPTSKKIKSSNSGEANIGGDK